MFAWLLKSVPGAMDGSDSEENVGLRSGKTITRAIEKQTGLNQEVVDSYYKKRLEIHLLIYSNRDFFFHLG